MNTAELLDAVQGLLRWVHVFSAILWIGQTYLFNWFEKHITRAKDSAPNVVGNLWMVHGGGYYVVEKQSFPEVMPSVLHWFKWEAAATWLSGIALIAITYYYGGLLAEPEKDQGVAIAVGVGVIVAGWVVYDLVVRTPLVQNGFAFAALSACALAGLVYGLNSFLSARAAYIHVGAMLGTIMAANVWLRILPAQRKRLAQSAKGDQGDASLQSLGPTRSKHNSYMAIPMVFIMISNHYPVTSYGHKYNWAILGALVAAGFAVARVLRGSDRQTLGEQKE